MGLNGSWTTIKKPSGDEWQEARFTTDDQREKREPVEVGAFKFESGSTDVALVLAGVHGSEPTGVEVALRLIDSLKSKRKRPNFTTIVIPRLFGPKRFAKKDLRYVVGEDALYRPKHGKRVMNIEPNRNLPRVGESYADVQDRGSRSGIELIDYYDRTFDYRDDKNVPLDTILADMMLAENRILVQIIQQEKPKRTASLHGKWKYNAFGDGPGIFVDPRGGFGPLLTWTKDGQIDDRLARAMVQTALKALPPSLIPSLKKIGSEAKKPWEQFHPFAGNLLSPSGLVSIDKGTVHYPVASHARGTSLGMWGSAEQLHEEGAPTLRDAMPVITVEIASFEQKVDPKQMIGPTLRSLLEDFLM